MILRFVTKSRPAKEIDIISKECKISRIKLILLHDVTSVSIVSFCVFYGV